VTTEVIATAGITTRHYTAQEVHPSDGYLRDYVAGVLAWDPDVILFMLGTNDSKYWRYDADLDPSMQNYDGALATYAANVTGVLDRFAAHVNGRGVAPKVILSSLPQVSPDYLDPPDSSNFWWDMNVGITQYMNPWLAQAAPAYENVTFVDTGNLMYKQGDWESWYSDYFHLWGADQAGYEWMADLFREHALARLYSPGDATFDGVVGSADLGILAANWRSTGFWHEGDFSLDGQVGVADLGLLAASWGTAAVPDPASLLLLAAIAPALTTRRQRVSWGT
jgi:lysophospholipase L1-like esterase